MHELGTWAFSLLLAGSLAGCVRAHSGDEDGGIADVGIATDGAACWEFTACDPQVGAAFRSYGSDYRLWDPSCHGTFAGVEGSTIRVACGGTERLIDARVDPSGLASMLAPGEPLAVLVDGPAHTVRLVRASDDALLFALVRPGYTDWPRPLPPDIEGLGVSAVLRPWCGFLQEYLGWEDFCPPQLMEEHDLVFLHADGSESVVPHGGAATITTPTGRFLVRNTTSVVMGHSSSGTPCAICAAYIYPEVVLDFVRLE